MQNDNFLNAAEATEERKRHKSIKKSALRMGEQEKEPFSFSLCLYQKRGEKETNEIEMISLTSI